MIEIINGLNLVYFLEKEKENIKRKLLYLLFKEIKNLNSLEFSVSSEYNDNNYFNDIRLNSVNNINIEPYSYSYFVDKKGTILNKDPDEYGSGDRDREGLEPVLEKNLIVASDELVWIGRVVQEVGLMYDYGDHVLNREDFQELSYESNFYSDHLGDDVAPSDFENDWNVLKELLTRKTGEFKGVDPRLTLIYSIFNKLDKNQENCFKENLEYAYYYAKYVLKDKLPKEIDNLFKMKSFEKEGLNEREKHFLNLYLASFEK
jgi:hypothetical protein